MADPSGRPANPYTSGLVAEADALADFLVGVRRKLDATGFRREARERIEATAADRFRRGDPSTASPILDAKSRGLAAGFDRTARVMAGFSAAVVRARDAIRSADLAAGKAVAGAARTAAPAARAAVATGTGLVTAGLVGTVEGYRLQTELHLLAMEFAGSFRPAILKAIEGLQQLRKFLEGFGPNEQRVVRNVGLGVGGLLAANRFGLVGGAAGQAGAAGAAGAAGVGAAEVGVAGAAGAGGVAAAGQRGLLSRAGGFLKGAGQFLLGAKFVDAADSAIRSVNLINDRPRLQRGELTKEEFAETGLEKFRAIADPKERLKALDERQKEIQAAFREQFEAVNSPAGKLRGLLGEFGQIGGVRLFGPDFNIVQGNRQINDVFRELGGIQRLKDEARGGPAFVPAGGQAPNPNREQLKLAQAGFGAAGSTFEDLQVELLKLGPDVTKQVDSQTELIKAIQDLTKVFSGINPGNGEAAGPQPARFVGRG